MLGLAEDLVDPLHTTRDELGGRGECLRVREQHLDLVNAVLVTLTVDGVSKNVIGTIDECVLQRVNLISASLLDDISELCVRQAGTGLSACITELCERVTTHVFDPFLDALV